MTDPWGGPMDETAHRGDGNDLQPGPAADALVAEAMGWTSLGQGDNWTSTCSTSDPPELANKMYGRHPSGCVCMIPAYTTTGNGMLAMLEWAGRQDWWELRMLYDSRCNPPWRCEIDIDDRREVGEMADTAPMAVAKALLAATEHSNEKG